MGPNVLFDKSFLQSLSVDESVWFDNFFNAIVCPLFFVETLADLEKRVRKGRKPEREVRIIAEKFPEGSYPSAYHARLCMDDLLGRSVPMTGQVLLPTGRAVESQGEIAVIMKEAPEAEAFRRWQNEEFREVERRFARAWREGLSAIDLKYFARDFLEIGIDPKSCKTLAEAKVFAHNVCTARNKALVAVKLAMRFLQVPELMQREVRRRWLSAGSPSLGTYAPYTSYVLEVELFFRMATAANLLSVNRSSNKVDIAYLNYLPFCSIFVSSDRLHEKCASLFLRDHQEFVWGESLKADLAKLNRFYSQLPEETKDRGVMSFAGYPPEDGDFLVSRLWDRHTPTWRQRRHFSPEETAHAESYVRGKMKEMLNAPTLLGQELSANPDKAPSILIQRTVRRTKGSWHLVPKNLKFPQGKV